MPRRSTASALEIETTKASDSTTLAHSIRMVGEAQSRRSQSEQWVERFARVYTPVILGLSFALFVDSAACVRRKLARIVLSIAGAIGDRLPVPPR